MTRPDALHPETRPESTGQVVASDVARVDLQADPSRWLPGKVLGIVGVIAIAAAVITMVVCLIVWLTPPMHSVDLPSVSKG